jgi:CheY-like chemotaxis protein
MTNMHAWIIEDNAPDAYLIQMALEKTELPVSPTIIDDGEEAMRQMHACIAGEVPAPDLMLLDLHLPKASGNQILRVVHQNHPLSRACLAVMSSLPASEHAVPLRPTDRYIQKSPHVREFVGNIIDWTLHCVKRAA